MSQGILLSDLTDGVIQFAFCASLLFSLLYGLLFRFRWWETVTGRSIFSLGPCVAGALLRGVLILWGVPVARLTSRGYTAPWYGWVLTWLSVTCVFGAGLVTLVLAWQSWRFVVAEEEGVRSRIINRLLWIKNPPPRLPPAAPDTIMMTERGPCERCRPADPRWDEDDRPSRRGGHD